MVKQLYNQERFFVDEFYRVHNPTVKPWDPKYIRFYMADSEEELVKELKLDLSIAKISFVDTRDGTYFEKYLKGAEKYKQEKKIYKLLNVGEHINWEDSNGD